MTIRVYIAPDHTGKPDNADGGIRRVVEAKFKYLPLFDIEVVHHPSQADVIVNNGATLIEHPGVPSVNANHGLYWSRQPWGHGYQEVNEKVVESMRHAVAHTAPSEWVSRAIRRGGLFYPEVVYHGVDAEDFSVGVDPTRESGYVLWNKARADYVSNPQDMQRLAAILPSRKFLTTIGQPTHNVTVFGAVPYNKMLELVRNAGVYLATARETFGIGTLEAMACGVPVAGWDWGGQSEIIVQGETGYLAFPGDFEALAECVERCYAERERLSANARADVEKRWRWEPRIEQYAEIIKRVAEEHYQERPKVSVIVTAYNLDKYLPLCLNSVMHQTMPDWECIVIDDAQSAETRKIVKEYAAADSRFHYYATPNNFGLVGSRNFGFFKSKGHYIRHLDADDYLAENALLLESDALDADRGLAIVYGHLEVVREDGNKIVDARGNLMRSNWPPDQFNWYQQMAHMNQLPSCVMMRREVLERSGGYRERMKRQEDAEFWCRVTSLGFRAQKITQAVTYYHRERGDSKGATEWREKGGEPDWTAWFPWRVGAADVQQAQEQFAKFGSRPVNANFVPFGAQGKPPGDLKFWPVHDFYYPVVSIIITCGPGHKQYLIDALDSVQAQTYPDWECIVVNDTGAPWAPNIAGAPWAKVVNMDGNRGASEARQEGYRHARGRYLAWLDADDYWLPWFLEKTVAYAELNPGIIYGDMLELDKDGKFKLYKYDEFDPAIVPFKMRYPGTSILIPREVFEAVPGGWDTEIPGMEDWSLQVAMHASGACAYHIPEPLFVYRLFSSTKREKDYNRVEDIKAYMDQKWAEYRSGAKQMACGCSQKRRPRGNPSSTLDSSGNFAAVQQEGQEGQSMVMVEYTGPFAETFSIRSRVDMGTVYRFGNNLNHRVRSVWREDAEWLISQIGADGKPLYRVLSGTGQEVHDPSAFVGQPIIT